jgi:phosphoribosylglycinamide formyltransferase-1
MDKSKFKIAIFASGAGSNARNFCRYFEQHAQVEIALLLSNKKDSGIPTIAQDFHIPHCIFNREQFYDTDYVLQILHKYEVSWVVLAGFLWLIPPTLVAAYPDKIINIHPALLPKYGGKGMYGMHVHDAVIANKECESGITIHIVNEHYDEGKILAQYKVDVLPNDTPVTLAQKIHNLEYAHFPVVVEANILQ